MPKVPYPYEVSGKLFTNWFLNTNVFLIKPFLITKFDCTMFHFQARNDREKMGWDKEYLHYTNEDNPYGDSNLTSTFRWQKKLEKDGIDKVDDHELQKMQRAKFEEQKRELEKVKQRRLDRERER